MNRTHLALLAIAILSLTATTWIVGCNDGSAVADSTPAKQAKNTSDDKKDDKKSDDKQEKSDKTDESGANTKSDKPKSAAGLIDDLKRRRKQLDKEAAEALAKRPKGKQLRKELDDYGKKFFEAASKGDQAAATKLFLSDDEVKVYYDKARAGILVSNRGLANVQAWKSVVATLKDKSAKLVKVTAAKAEFNERRKSTFQVDVFYTKQLTLEFEVGGAAAKFYLRNLLRTKDGWKTLMIGI